MWVSCRLFRLRQNLIAFGMSRCWGWLEWSRIWLNRAIFGFKNSQWMSGSWRAAEVIKIFVSYFLIILPLAVAGETEMEAAQAECKKAPSDIKMKTYRSAVQPDKRRPSQMWVKYAGLIPVDKSTGSPRTLALPCHWKANERGKFGNIAVETWFGAI